MAKEYIERESLIDKMSKLKTGGIFTEVFKKVVLEIISNQPTAAVQDVRHGEWEKSDFDVVCSRCGYIESAPRPFCSECGTKMDKE